MKPGTFPATCFPATGRTKLAQGVRPSWVFSFDKMVSTVRERAPRWDTSLAPHGYRHGDSSAPARVRPLPPKGTASANLVAIGPARARLGRRGVTKTGEFSNAISGENYSAVDIKTLKAELVWRTVFQTRAEASASIARYIERFYNPVRRHSALDFVSPVQFENAMA